MAKNWSKSEAFASFGAKGINPRWSWSARDEDGKTVVLTLWGNMIVKMANPSTTIAPPSAIVREKIPKEAYRNALKRIIDCHSNFKSMLTVPIMERTLPRNIYIKSIKGHI